MTLLFAFLHHVLAFVLVAALAIELVLVKDRISIERARRICVPMPFMAHRPCCCWWWAFYA